MTGKASVAPGQTAAVGVFRRAALLGFLVPALLSATLPSQSAPRKSQHRKKLIAWGGIDWYSPETVRTNIRRIEELPFDGTVLQGFKAHRGGREVHFDWLCFGQERFEREQLVETIATLKAIDFRRFTDNFLRFNVTPGDVDWFDDYGPILHNARLWAEVAKETGMKGWAFDVEDYKGTVFDYRKQEYGTTRSFHAYEQQARLRGGQFMQAVQSGYPDIVLLLMLAHSYVNRADRAGERLAEHEYGLLPAFLNGMLEKAGPRVTLIDGQEQAYGYLTARDYREGTDKIRNDALSLVPPALHETYRKRMDVGVAVWANHVFALNEYPGHWATHFLNPRERLQVFEQNVYQALKEADQYVWLYSERLGWWQEQGWSYLPPPGTLEAVRTAREKIRRGRPLGSEVPATRIEEIRSNLKKANPFPARQVALFRSQVAPSIDGELTDSVWKDAPALPSLIALTERKGTAPTITQAAFDESHLYLAFRCSEPAPKRLKGNGVEISIRSGEGMLPYTFAVNPSREQRTGPGDAPDSGMRCRSGARFGNNEWTAEVAIPWASLGATPGVPFDRRVSLVHRRAIVDQVSALVLDLYTPAEK